MSRRLFLWTLIITGLLMAGCEIKSPSAPKWDVEFNVPLMNKNYYGGDLLSGENFGQDSLNVMNFNTNGLVEGAVIDTMKISENVEGSGLVPIQQVVGFGDSVSVHNPANEDDIQIVSGDICSGGLQIYFDQIHPALSKVTLHFDEIKDTQGNSFSFEVDNPYNGRIDIINLDGYKIQNDNPDEILEDIHFTISQESSDPNIPILGYLKVYYTSPLYFSKMRGYMNERQINADDFSSAINAQFPENIENALHLNTPTMSIDIWNKIGFKANFVAQFTARNTRTNLVVTVPVSGLINACDEAADSTLTQLVLDDEAEALMAIAPDQFELINPKFYVSHEVDHIGFAEMGKGYGGTYQAVVPFDFTLTEGQYIKPADLTILNISEDNQTQINDNLKSAELTVHLYNEFPAGMDISIYICSSDDRNVVYQDSDYHSSDNDPNPLDRIVFLDNHVEAGVTGTPNEKILTFTLDQEALRVFAKHPTAYLGLKFGFDDANTQIHSYDKIKVITALKAQLMIDPGN